MIDEPKDIRAGEELDLDALTTHLKDQVPGFESIVEIRQFPGGYSNLTYLLKTNLGEWVLRRPPFGANIKSAHDMGREYRVLSLLKPHYSRVPQPIYYGEDESVIGAPFYLMERVKGIILRGRPPKGLPLTPENMLQLSQATIQNLVDLHALNLSETGLLNFGKPEGYVERQVNGWIKRYYKAETDTVPAMDELARWMPENQPAANQPSLIHNDYKYDNLVLDPENLSEIKSVLDWEMATIGDPLMDLGTSLAYWTETKEAELMPLAAANLTWLPGNLDRMAVVDYYAQRSGRDLSDYLFYYVFGNFKIGVIIQQIYARYKQGHTKDPRFAGLLAAVQHFGKQGQRALELERISQLH